MKFKPKQQEVREHRFSSKVFIGGIKLILLDIDSNAICAFYKHLC